MAERKKAYLLRIDPDVLDDLQRWAADDLRSVNAQIEWLLRRALLDSGRASRRVSGSAPRRPYARSAAGESEASRAR